MVVHLLMASTDITLVYAVGALLTVAPMLFVKDGLANFHTSVVVYAVGVMETHKAGGV